MSNRQEARCVRVIVTTFTDAARHVQLPCSAGSPQGGASFPVIGCVIVFVPPFSSKDKKDVPNAVDIVDR
ncbi:hypothetical protein [Tepidimonas charontis]|uniref:hypothetical protein n=1 Tax=Tepidimonas charontis TaxID=2267262 RepID=UPI00118485ED|nr:hypothetical protein [Tepidimonas charontis]